MSNKNNIIDSSKNIDIDNNKKPVNGIGQNNSFNISTQEKNTFLEPNREIKWNYSIQKSYHLKQNIERVWFIIKNFEFLSMISNANNYPIIIVKGENTWKLGNEFKGNIFGKYPFVARVYKLKIFPEKKIIEWLFNLIDNNYFKIKLELFQVTDDNSTCIVKKIKYENQKLLSNFEKVLDFGKSTTFQKIEQILESEPINLLKYESGVISGKMKDIWNIITDFNQLTAIAPNNNFLPNINLRTMKIGEKSTASVIINEVVKDFDIYLRIKDERPGWNKWIVLLEIYEGKIEKKLNHSILFQLTKINNTECQFTVISKFFVPLKADEFREISLRKKYLLLSIKDFFSNFYSPNTEN